MFQGRIIDELTEIVQRAEHRARANTETRHQIVAEGPVTMEPHDDDRNVFLLGAA